MATEILFTLFFQKSVCIWKKGAKTRIMTIYGEQTVITWSTLNFAAARESDGRNCSYHSVTRRELEKCVGLFMISVTEMETVSHILIQL